MTEGLPLSYEDEQPSLEQLLSEYPFLREIQAKLQADPFEAVLPRLAIPRCFNADLYDRVISGGAPLTFEQLVQRPEVRPLPDRPGYYWLADSCMERGRRSADDNRRPLAQAILNELERNSDLPIIDRLTVLSFANPTAALPLWTGEFEGANARNDFAELYTHTQVMEGLLPYLPPPANSPLATGLLELKARYSARAQFLREWHRTVAYWPRTTAEGALKNLLENDGKEWIFQLYATGGMGKTMFLEAQIARSLVLGENRALVARIDLDFISVNSLVNIPWLIAIEIGRQLDPQLPVPYFRDFLSKLQPYTALLYSPQSDRYRAISPDQAASLQQQARAERGNWDRFVSLCTSLPSDRRVVLILDTVEEASIYFPTELRRLLTNVESLHGASKRFRLVLSGRYHLGVEHMEELYDEKLKAATAECTLTELRDPEDAKFVRHRLPEIGDEMLKAVLKLGQGHPFKLSLLIELLISEPLTKAEDLSKHGDADIAYLIQRVIRRIPSSGLRWLVRYGSVPRRLTRSFVREVMVPHLERALKGEYRDSKEDDPEHEDWYPDSNANLDPEHLWEELSRYSSERGWINLDPTDPDLASFHPDIVNPTRRLLSTQKVFQTLHREAAEFAAKQAEANPERASDHRLAEFYHRIQLPEVDIEKALRKLFERFTDPLASRDVAEELRSNRDFANVPKRWPNLVLAEAFVATSDWRYLQTHSAWYLIRSYLSAALSASPEPLPRFFAIWLASDGSATQVDVDALRAIVDDCKVDVEDRLRCVLLLDELLPEASRLELLQDALDAARLAQGMIREPVMRERLGLLQREMGQLSQSRDNLEAAWRGAANLAIRQRILRLWVDVSIEMFRTEAAQRVLLDENKVADPDYRHFLGRQLARVHLELENPWGALRVIRDGDRDPETLLLRANAFAQQLRVSEALELYRGIEQTAGPEMREAAIVARSRMMVKEVGLDTRESLRELPRALGECEILRAWGIGSADLLEMVGPGWQKQGSLRFRAHLLQGAGPAELSSVNPASARLRCLDWPLLESALKSAAPGVEAYFGSQPSGITEVFQFNLRFADLLRATGQFDRARETLKVIFVPPATRKPNLWPLTAWRRRRQIEDRIAEQDPSFQVELDSPDMWKEFEDTPLLYQACLVELGVRAMKCRNLDVVRQCLLLAQGVATSQTRYGGLYRTINVQLLEADAPATGASSPPNPSMSHAASPRQDNVNIEVLARQSGRLMRWALSTGQVMISVADDPALEAAIHPRLHGRILSMLVDQPEEVTRQFDEVIGGGWVIITDSVLAGLPWEHSSKGVCRFVPCSSELRLALARAQFKPEDLYKAWDSQSDPQPRSIHPIIVVTPRRDQRTAAFFKFQDGIQKLSDVFRTQLLNPAMEEGGLPLPTGGVSVLHITSGIVEIQGVPALLSLDMNPAGLANRLRTSSRDHKPIVILDPPRPYSESERLECILVRNRFAQELAESGTVEAVLATGLGADEHQQKIYDILLDCMQSRARLEDTWRRIQNAGDDLTYRATALFACNPKVVLP